MNAVLCTLYLLLENRREVSRVTWDFDFLCTFLLLEILFHFGPALCKSLNLSIRDIRSLSFSGILIVFRLWILLLK